MSQRRIERPLDDDAVRSADNRIYEAHKKDTRPNALFDSFGRRKELSASDPSQEALRQEWREYYFAALDAEIHAGANGDGDSIPAPPPHPDRSDPVVPVRPCRKTHWITFQLKPFQTPGKRPKFWPPAPDDKLYAATFYLAEITDGHKEDHLDQSASAGYFEIPEGPCEVRFPLAIAALTDYFSTVLGRPAATSATPPAPVPTHWIAVRLKPHTSGAARPRFWPPPPDDTAYRAMPYRAELPSGPKADRLDGSGLVTFLHIPEGQCDIWFASDDLTQFFDKRVRKAGAK